MPLGGMLNDGVLWRHSTATKRPTRDAAGAFDVLAVVVVRTIKDLSGSERRQH